MADISALEPREITEKQARKIIAQPISAEAFAPYGALVDFDREPDFAINAGTCQRYHALAHCRAEGQEGQVAISLGRAQPIKLPLELKLMERHPLGTQAFIPLEPVARLVVVAPDKNGKPGRPLAFITGERQGIQYHINTWHGVFTPLHKPCDVLIVDRVGLGENLEEHVFNRPYLLSLPHSFS